MSTLDPKGQTTAILISNLCYLNHQKGQEAAHQRVDIIKELDRRLPQGDKALDAVEGAKPSTNVSQNFDEHEQSPVEIQVDFKRTWDRLSFIHDRLIHVHGDHENIDFMHALREVRDMFQNPAVIIPKD